MINEKDKLLIAQFLEEKISDEEFAQFQQRLRAVPAIRERLRAELNLESGLRDLAAGDSRFVELWGTDEKQTPTRTDSAKIRRWAAFGLFVVVCAIIAFIWPLFHSKEVLPAKLLRLGGNVAVVDAYGRTHLANVKQPILAGERIVTQGDDSFATIAFEDGTQVVLVSDSTVQLAGIRPIQITVLSGMISANVAIQPEGFPMIIATPNDSVEVLGTTFALEASSKRTQIRVSQGRVRLTRSRDGRSVLVAQGKRVVSDALSPGFVLEDARTVGDTWVEDFDKDMPRDWQFGEFVRNGVPNGSFGAVQSEYYASWDSYLITTPNRWIDGLFAVHADTHVHFTFKMASPGWLNMFCQVRTGNEKDPTDLFQCNNAPFGRAETDKWYTMTVPMSEWKRNDDVHDRGFVDPPPKVGEVVYVMSWSSRRVFRGLVIDRIWVTRGGPGKIELKLWDR